MIFVLVHFPVERFELTLSPSVMRRCVHYSTVYDDMPVAKGLNKMKDGGKEVFSCKSQMSLNSNLFSRINFKKNLGFWLF